MAQPPYQAGPGAWQSQGGYGHPQHHPQPPNPMGPQYAAGGPPPPPKRGKSGCVVAVLGVSVLMVVALVVVVGLVVLPELRAGNRPVGLGNRTSSPEREQGRAEVGTKLKTVEREGSTS